MKKMWKIGVLTAAVSAAMSFTALAGQWEQNATGYYWQEDDGSYPVSQWKWIDGNGDGISECYYFNENGYMARNMFIGGYRVNDGGAWIENGEVQVRKSWELVKDSDNAREILEAVLLEENNAKAIDMGFFMNMQMSADADIPELQNLDININGDMKMRNAQSSNLQYIMKMNMDMLGETVETTAFYADGWYYYDMYGEKIKLQMPYEKAYQSIAQYTELPSDDLAYIQDISMARNGSDITVYYTADAGKMMDEVNAVYDAMGMSLSDLGLGMNITQCKAEITVDADGNYKNQRMLLDMELGVDADKIKMHMYMDADIRAINDAVQFELPSTEGYQDFYAYLAEAVGAEQ